MQYLLFIFLTSIISYVIGWYWHDKMMQDRIRDQVKRVVGVDFGRCDDVFQLMRMLHPLNDEDLRKVFLE